MKTTPEKLKLTQIQRTDFPGAVQASTWHLTYEGMTHKGIQTLTRMESYNKSSEIPEFILVSIYDGLELSEY